MKSDDVCTDREEPPGHVGNKRPNHPWKEVPLTRWHDWCWQLAHRLNTIKDSARIIHLTPAEEAGLSIPGRFRVDVSPRALEEALLAGGHQVIPLEGDQTLPDSADLALHTWAAVPPEGVR
jgi:L-lysine 2,3-aminomutase